MKYMALEKRFDKSFVVLQQLKYVGNTRKMSTLFTNSLKIYC